MPSVAINTEFLIGLYRRMLMVRRVEEHLAALAALAERKKLSALAESLRQRYPGRAL